MLIISGCKEENDSQQVNKTVSTLKPETKTNSKTDTISFRGKVKRYVENKLKINAAENYDLQIVWDYIDRDTIKDAVILVNRKEFALNEIKRKGREKFFKYLGYSGPYNYVFVYLGGTGDFLNAPPVGSNVYHPLTVDFGRVSSPSQNDFWVEYRTKNSMQRLYYTVRNNNLHVIFNCPVFDRIGEDDPVFYDIQHLESSVRIGRDIALFYAVDPNHDESQIEDPLSYTPKEIVNTEELYVYFIFDDQDLVYKTPMKPTHLEEEE